MGKRRWRFALLPLGWLAIGAPFEAGVVRSLTDPRDGIFEHTTAAIDAAGTAVYFSSASAQFAPNTRPAAQIVRCNLPAGPCIALTSFDDGVAGTVSVTDDAQWLAFVSTADPLGLNHDESLELFVMRPDGTALSQLTSGQLPNPGQILDARITGSGNRVLFASTANPLGTNPSGVEQLFIVDRNGANLRQLTFEAGGTLSGIGIADDGVRIVFGHDSGGTQRVWAIQADGTGRHQFVPDGVVAPVISGDGITVAFHGLADNGVFAIDWDGTDQRLIGGGRDLAIRDDGKFLWLTRGDGEIGSINTSSLETVRVTFSPAGVSNDKPVVSGSGGRVAFRSHGGAHPGGNNPDGSYELLAMDGAGGNLQQLTQNEVAAFERYPAITADGTRIVFASRRPTGDTASPFGDLYRIQADGTDLVRLTDLAEFGAFQPSISADGATIVFSTYYPSGSATIQRVFADGTGLLQLSPSFGNESPEIAADGSVVVYERLSTWINRVAPDGSGLAAVATGSGFREPRLSETGEWVAFQTGDCGPQPEQVGFARIDGSNRACVTSDPDYRAWLPDISGDGEWVVYSSNADPLGANPEHNLEIFAYRRTTAERRQLTVTPTGGSWHPRVTRNGTWVYFFSSGPYFDAAVEPLTDLYRVSLAEGVVERVAGLRAAATTLNDYAVSADGSRIVFTGAANASDENPECDTEAFLADFAAPAQIRVSRESPTVVEWDPEPHFVRYDVIRGDVAALESAGGVIELGPVECLEEDSPDAHTAGHGDVVEPAPGEAFFFLYRGTQGVGDTMVSWGRGSGGEERVAGEGQCGS